MRLYRFCFNTTVAICMHCTRHHSRSTVDRNTARSSKPNINSGIQVAHYQPSHGFIGAAAISIIALQIFLSAYPVPVPQPCYPSIWQHRAKYRRPCRTQAWAPVMMVESIVDHNSYPVIGNNDVVFPTKEMHLFACYLICTVFDILDRCCISCG